MSEATEERRVEADTERTMPVKNGSDLHATECCCASTKTAYCERRPYKGLEAVGTT